MSTRKASPTAVLAVVAFGVFVAADDLTVVTTMFRQIVFDLEIPLPDELNRAAWIVNAYLIAYVVVMPFVGRLSDILGRRAVYIGSLLLFLAGSIWVPLAGSLNSFILGRVVTAVGGGAMVPVAMAVIGDVFPRQSRATALGTLGAVDTAGWIWGPLYGALLINFLSWEWQFYLNIPLALIGIILAWWALADLPLPARREPIDWVGAVLLALGIISLNVGLLANGDLQAAGSFNELQGSTSPEGRWFVAAGLLLLLLFAWFETYLSRRLRAGGERRFYEAPPLIDLSLFRRRNFSPAVLINFLVGASLIIAMVNVPLLVNVLEGDVSAAALTSGLLLSGMTVAMAVAAYVGGRQTNRRGYRAVTMTGLLLCLIGFALMGLTWQPGSPTFQFAWQLVVLGLGFGLVIAPIGTAVINAASDRDRGVAASLVIVFRLFGMSVGLSALTAWGLRRFQALRQQIALPDLSLTDPAYQQALLDGLTAVTVNVLTETFLVSAVVVLLALLVALRLRPDPAQAIDA